MKLRYYQKFVIDKLNKHDKCYISWLPGLGITRAINHYLVEYLNVNSDKDVFIFSNTSQQNKHNMHDLLNTFDFYNSFNIIKDITNNKIKFNNYNIVKYYPHISSVEFEFYGAKPDIVIFDNIDRNNDKYLHIIDRFIHNHKPHVIFIDDMLNINFFKYFDHNNDYYINIIPNFYKIDYKKYYKSLKIQLSYKNSDMVDFFDKRFERKEKLKKIISNKNV